MSLSISHLQTKPAAVIDALVRDYLLQPIDLQSADGKVAGQRRAEFVTALRTHKLWPEDARNR